MAGFGGAVKLTGESEYRRALKQITQNLREVSSEMKVVSTAYAGNDKSTQALAAKQDVLNKQLAAQKERLAALKNQYASMSQQYTTQTQKHDALVKSYDTEKAKLAEIGRTLGTSSKEYQAQAKIVDNLAKEVDKSAKAQDANAKSMSDMRVQMNGAQADINKTTKELENLGKAAQDASKSASDSNGGYTVMKNVMANLATQGIMMAVNALSQLKDAIVDTAKAAVNSYADYEQLVGGVETIFKDAAPIVQDYAQNAYKTAGLSANDYMETVTSFSASLIQGLGGDTAAAAQAANTAITDMSDNANKMGTDIGSIMNAYQGFAKQNYTMLDNLKLGYGGTQSEMARLINDSGVLGDSVEVTANTVKDVPFDKIIEAIHTIQTEIGITGTTAKEASETIQGSGAAMKAAWQNTLTGMADENQKLAPLFTQLMDSVFTYMSNILPRIGETMRGMTEAVQLAISELMPRIGETMQTYLPQFVETGTLLIVELVKGLVHSLPLLYQGVTTIINTLLPTLGKAIPDIVNTVVLVVPSLVQALNENIPTFINASIDFFLSMIDAIPELINALLEAIPTVITSIIDGLLSGVDALLNGAMSLLYAIVQAIPKIIPVIVQNIPKIIDTLVNGLVKALPQLMNGAITLLMAIIDAIPRILPTLINAIPQIITTIVQALANNTPAIINAGVQLFIALIQNMPLIVSTIAGSIPQIISGIVQAVLNGIPAMVNAGFNLLMGLKDGIVSAVGNVVSAATNVASDIVGGIKNFLGIQSPSKLMRDLIGKNMAAGIAVGFADEMGNVEKQMEKDGVKAVNGITSAMNGALANVDFVSTMQNATMGIASAIPGTMDAATANGALSYDGIVTAFKDALSQMKIELNDDEMGRFVDQTVTRLVYS